MQRYRTVHLEQIEHPRVYGEKSKKQIAEIPSILPIHQFGCISVLLAKVSQRGLVFTITMPKEGKSRFRANDTLIACRDL